MAFDLIARLRLNDEFTDRLRRATNEMDRAQTQTTRLATSITSLGGIMSGLGGGMALGGLATSIVKTGMEFEAKMSGVQAVSGATGKEFEALKNQAKDLGSTTQFSATQAADGMQYLAMAGFKTNDILQAMPGMLNLAAAGHLDLGKAADIASNIMTSFGIKTSKSTHVADVLARAASNSNTSVEQLGYAMKYLGPTSKNAKWSLEETTSAVMALSDAGIQGEMAGAAFSTSLGRLASPTKEASKQMDSLGISFYDSQGKMKPLADIIDMLNNQFAGLTDEQKTAAMTTLFGAEAYKHWAVLLDKGGDALRKNTKDLETADGAAQKMAKTMNDNLKGRVDELKSAFEGLQIDIFEQMKPGLERNVELLTKLVDMATLYVALWAGDGDKAQKIAEKLYGDDASKKIKTMSSDVEDLRDKYDMLSSVLSKVGGFMKDNQSWLIPLAKFVAQWLFFARVLKIVNGIIGKTLLKFKDIKDKVDKTRETIQKLKQILDKLKSSRAGATLGRQFRTLANDIRIALMMARQLATSVSGKIFTKLGNAASKVGPMISKAFNFGGTILRSLGGLMSKVGGFFSRLIGPIARALAPIGRVLFTALMGSLKFLPRIGGLLARVLPAIFGGPVGIVISILLTLIPVGMAIYKNWDKITGMLSKVWDKVTEKLSSVKESVTEKLSGVKETAAEQFSGIGEKISEKFSGIKETVVGKLSEFKQTAIETITGLPEAIAEKFTSLKEMVTSKFTELGTAVAEKLTYFKENWRQILYDGLMSAFEGLGFIIGFAVGKFEELRAQAIEKIILLVLGIGQKLFELKEAFVGKVGELKEAFLTKMGELKEGAILAFTGFIEATKTKFIEWKTALITTVTEFVLALPQKLAEMKEQAILKIIELTVAFGEQLVLWKDQAILKVTEFALAFANQLVLWKDQAVLKVTEFALAFANQLIVWKDQAVAKVSEFITSFTAKMAEWKTQAIAKVTEFATTFPQKIGEAKDRALAKITEFATQLPAKVGTAKDQAIAKAQEFKSGFEAKFREAKDAAVKQIAELPGKIAGKVGEIPGRIAGAISQVQAAFSKLGAAIPRAIESGFNSAKASLSSAGSWAVDKVMGGMDIGGAAMKSFSKGFSSGKSKGKGHSAGLDNVPYTNYQATLHKGEKVLTREEAKAYREGKGPGTGGNSYHFNIEYNGTGSSKADVEGLMKLMAEEIRLAGGLV